MKKLLILAMMCLLVGCDSEPQKTVTINDLEQASLDVVYGFRLAFMEDARLSGAGERLQAILRAWPQERQSKKEPCYMQLKQEAVRVLNLADGLTVEDKTGTPDYRWECRQKIKYRYDEARVRALWANLKN